jgi:uncharacterized protein
MKNEQRGSVQKWQLISTDPDASATFYANAFGWKIDRANAMGYRVVDSGPSGAAGGIWPAPAGAQSFVQLFIAVDDVDKAITDAVALGASIVVPKTVLPDGDTMAVLHDPQRVAFGLFASRPPR